MEQEQKKQRDIPMTLEQEIAAERRKIEKAAEENPDKVKIEQIHPRQERPKTIKVDAADLIKAQRKAKQMTHGTKTAKQKAADKKKRKVQKASRKTNRK